MSIELADYDPAEFLDTAEARAEYVSVIMEDGDAEELREALATVARAERMAGVSTLSRADIDGTLGPDGTPPLDALTSVLDTLGLRLAVVAKKIPAA